MDTPQPTSKKKKQEADTPTLLQRIDAAQERADALERQSNDSSSEQRGVLPDTFLELNISLEELRVADEELSAKNDELVSAYHQVAFERQRYRDLFNFAPDCYLVTDIHANIQAANHAATVLFNLEQEYLSQKPLAVFIDPNQRHEFSHKLSAIQHTTSFGEWKIHPRDQPSFIDVSITVSRMQQREQPDLLLWHLRDVTRQTELAQALQESETKNRIHSRLLAELNQCILEVQENEKRALARELHDEVGQVLTALKMMLQAHSCQHDPETGLKEPIGILNDLIAQVRNLSLELRPTILDDLGLVPALEWYFKRYTTRTLIKVDFQWQSLEGRMPPLVETTAFRIIQEALTNVARYAQVDTVLVQLYAKNKVIHLEVTDQGKGFDLTTAFASHTSVGLRGMRERAEWLGGDFKIATQPSQGCSIKASLPFETIIP